MRIRRLLSEEEPSLSNFDGDRIARERRYQDRNLGEGLAAFAAARARNLERLRSASRSDWKRRGAQEGVGRISLADIPRRMAEHDLSHTRDVADLLAEIRGSKGRALPVGTHLRRRLGGLPRLHPLSRRGDQAGQDREEDDSEITTSKWRCTKATWPRK